MIKFFKNLSFIFFILIFLLFISYFRGTGKKLYFPENTILVSENKSETDKTKNKIYYFWATWCGVCQANLSLIKFSEKKLTNLFGFEFISFEEGSSGILHAKNYIDKNEISYTVYLANNEILKKNFVEGFPMILFTNSKNEIFFSDTGFITPIGILLRMILVNLLNV